MPDVNEDDEHDEGEDGQSEGNDQVTQEPEGEEEEGEVEDDNPLHVVVKESHADELVEILNRYGYSELAKAFSSADVGETIEVKVVED